VSLNCLFAICYPGRFGDGTYGTAESVAFTLLTRVYFLVYSVYVFSIYRKIGCLLGLRHCNVVISLFLFLGMLSVVMLDRFHVCTAFCLRQTLLLAIIVSLFFVEFLETLTLFLSFFVTAHVA